MINLTVYRYGEVVILVYGVIMIVYCDDELDSGMVVILVYGVGHHSVGVTVNMTVYRYGRHCCILWWWSL